MELKLNTWYVWLWNYTYGESLPNNLCPFFWKLVAAMLLFIPNLILRIPVVIINLFHSKHNRMGKNDARTGIGSVIYVIVVIAIFIIMCLYNYVLWFYK